MDSFASEGLSDLCNGERYFGLLAGPLILLDCCYSLHARNAESLSLTSTQAEALRKGPRSHFLYSLSTRSLHLAFNGLGHSNTKPLGARRQQARAVLFHFETTKREAETTSFVSGSFRLPDNPETNANQVDTAF